MPGFLFIVSIMPVWMHGLIKNHVYTKENILLIEWKIVDNYVTNIKGDAKSKITSLTFRYNKY